MTATGSSQTVARVTLIVGASTRTSWDFIPGRSVDAIYLGTDPRCEWRLDAPGVAPRHARLAFDGSSVWFTSIAADASVLVDGGVIGDEWVELHVGNALTVGEVVLCAEAAPEDDRDIPERPTERPMRALVELPTALHMRAPADEDATQPPISDETTRVEAETTRFPAEAPQIDAEATRIALPLPPGVPREHAEARAPSPQLGSAATELQPVQATEHEPPSPQAARPLMATRPLESTDRIRLEVRQTPLRLFIGLGAITFVGVTAVMIGVWSWATRDGPQSLATTPEAAHLPAVAHPPQSPAGELPHIPPVLQVASPAPLPGEGSALAQAVALIAEGRISDAALAYERLAHESPEHPELAIVARALRARARGGTR